MVRTKRFIGKTTTTEKGKDSHKAASSVNVLSTGWWEAARATQARGRVRRGCLLDEGADCVCEVGFVKRRQTPVFKQTPKEKLSKRELI